MDGFEPRPATLRTRNLLVLLNATNAKTARERPSRLRGVNVSCNEQTSPLELA